MTRYLIERTFPGGLDLRSDEHGVNATAKIVEGNAEYGVTWVHSYVSPDRTTTHCIYDGPSPEAIRKAAERNGMPWTGSVRSACSTRTSTITARSSSR